METLHIALGGFTKAMAHRLGEKGREFVIDADSTAAIERMLSWIICEANLAKGAECNWCSDGIYIL